MLLAFSYPFMKRITYWPQFFLGITFNWGLIMAWAASTNYISQEIIIFYLSAIFWTLGYDTIYGAQDIKDDEIIGVKSTSIKFKKNIKQFVSINYLLSSLLIIYLIKNELGFNFLTFFMVIFILTLFLRQLLRYYVRYFLNSQSMENIDTYSNTVNEKKESNSDVQKLLSQVL